MSIVGRRYDRLSAWDGVALATAGALVAVVSNTAFRGLQTPQLQ
jgi:hypothetical protein